MAHSYLDDECEECGLYIKPVSNAGAWRCVLCLIAESAICFDGETMIWNRYELPCGHEAHERCYRTWAKSVNAVGCPHCGIVAKTTSARYCDVCEAFGHVKTADCLVNQARANLMVHAAEAKEERAKYVPFSITK